MKGYKNGMGLKAPILCTEKESHRVSVSQKEPKCKWKLKYKTKQDTEGT